MKKKLSTVFGRASEASDIVLLRDNKIKFVCVCMTTITTKRFDQLLIKILHTGYRVKNLSQVC